jgi:hypothetical protein
MVVIIPPRHNGRVETVEKPGITRRGGGFASAGRGRARCAAMMSKRFVAAVLIGCLVLAGGGILGSLFF